MSNQMMRKYLYRYRNYLRAQLSLSATQTQMIQRTQRPFYGIAIDRPEILEVLRSIPRVDEDPGMQLDIDYRTKEVRRQAIHWTPKLFDGFTAQANHPRVFQTESDVLVSRFKDFINQSWLFPVDDRVWNALIVTQGNPFKKQAVGINRNAVFETVPATRCPSNDWTAEAKWRRIK